MICAHCGARIVVRAAAGALALCQRTACHEWWDRESRRREAMRRLGPPKPWTPGGLYWGEFSRRDELPKPGIGQLLAVGDTALVRDESQVYVCTAVTHGTGAAEWEPLST